MRLYVECPNGGPRTYLNLVATSRAQIPDPFNVTNPTCGHNFHLYRRDAVFAEPARGGAAGGAVVGGLLGLLGGPLGLILGGAFGAAVGGGAERADQQAADRFNAGD